MKDKIYIEMNYASCIYCRELVRTANGFFAHNYQFCKFLSIKSKEK